MHKQENVGPVELATISFGQSFQVTADPACDNCFFYYKWRNESDAAFWRGRIRKEDGTLVETLEYETTENICSTETSDNVCSTCLRRWCRRAEEKMRIIEGYSIGGKTATSQTLPRSENRYISSFLGFAPADAYTKVLVLAIIDNPEGTYYGGLDSAALGSSKKSWKTFYLYLDKIRENNVYWKS